MRIPCKVNGKDGHIVEFAVRPEMPTMAIVVFDNGTIVGYDLNNIKVMGKDEQAEALSLIVQELMNIKNQIGGLYVQYRNCD